MTQLQLQLTGRGEDAMRMDKRLRCAGRALGVEVRLDWDASRAGPPVVYHDGMKVVEGLVPTESLEALLRPLIQDN